MARHKLLVKPILNSNHPVFLMINSAAMYLSMCVLMSQLMEHSPFMKNRLGSRSKGGLPYLPQLKRSISFGGRKVCPPGTCVLNAPEGKSSLTCRASYFNMDSIIINPIPSISLDQNCVWCWKYQWKAWVKPSRHRSPTCGMACMKPPKSSGTRNGRGMTPADLGESAGFTW